MDYDSNVHGAILAEFRDEENSRSVLTTVVEGTPSLDQKSPAQ